MVFGRKSGDKAAKKPKPKKEKRPKAKKKPKPARKSKSAEGVVIKKRPTDIYSVMLMMSLGFVLLAIVFLLMELGTYGFGFSNFTPWK